MNDTDKDFKDVRERLRDFEPEVEPQLWEYISQKMAKPRYTALTVGVVVLSAVLVGFAAMVFFAPKAEQKTVRTALANTWKPSIDKSENECPIRRDETAFRASETGKEFTETAFHGSESAGEPTALLPTASTAREKPVQTMEEAQTEPKSVKAEATNVKINHTDTTPRVQAPASESMEGRDESKGADVEEEIVRFKLFIPNAFTPQEATNNIFRPAKVEVKDYRMDIYNGKGVRMFTTNEINAGWDGTFEGEICMRGVYYYIIKFTDLKGNPHTQKGSLMLLR